MKRDIAPGIIVPNRDFLVGAMYGFNAARRRLEENPQPLFGSEIAGMDEVSNEDFYLGSWLEITCSKCGMLYTFNGPNDLTPTNLECTNKECDNIIILYGNIYPEQWRIGAITFI